MAVVGDSSYLMGPAGPVGPVLWLVIISAPPNPESQTELDLCSSGLASYCLASANSFAREA